MFGQFVVKRFFIQIAYQANYSFIYDIQLDMDEQSSYDFKFDSRSSLIERLSFNRPIDQDSAQYSDISLSKRPSMVEALGVNDLNRKSSLNINSQLDQDSVHKSVRISGNSKKDHTLENFNMFEQSSNFQELSNRYDRHQCICSKDQCNMQLCPCFLYLNELCIIGLCCQKCIVRKNEYFQDNKQVQFEERTKNKTKAQKDKKNFQRQNNHIKPHKQKIHLKHMPKVNKARVHKQKYDFVYCSCKKTQCMKKYCPCYAINKQCNQCCTCQECQNQSDDDESQDQEKYKRQKYARVINNPNKTLKRQDSISGADFIQNDGPNKLIMKIEDQINNYFEQQIQDYSKIELNQEMNFEPVNFTEYNMQ